MEWWDTVIWSSKNIELTNGKLVIIIPLLILSLLCLITALKMLLVAPRTRELFIYYRFLGALNKKYMQNKISKANWERLREWYSPKNLFIPDWWWAWCPWKWTTKQMFIKGKYEMLINLTTVLQAL